MKNILFLCTANSCRSQMAEGYANAIWDKKYSFFSAGTKKSVVNPLAIKVMQEDNIDLSTHTSKTSDELPNVKMDLVITVCSSAKESCPFFPSSKIIHIGFDDPPQFAAELNDEEEVLQVYRRVRDEIKAMVLNLENYLETK